MHCYEIIPSWKAWLCLTRGLGRAALFDCGQWRKWRGSRSARRPPGKLNAKNGPPLRDFMNCRIWNFVVSLLPLCSFTSFSLRAMLCPVSRCVNLPCKVSLTFPRRFSLGGGHSCSGPCTSLQPNMMIERNACNSLFSRNQQKKKTQRDNVAERVFPWFRTFLAWEPAKDKAACFLWRWNRVSSCEIASSR